MTASALDVSNKGNGWPLIFGEPPKENGLQCRLPNVKQPLSANERIKGKGHRRREVGSGGRGRDIPETGAPIPHIGDTVKRFSVINPQ